ncbi:hypothetical protein [Spirosoma endbachense]|uniref:Uncharacterized protein n=1 Tax=Spirosoma endbachense TaxID=2666025 RepID=A0A6P1W010_9BACT|nr:hypothetical protein [Spirosoma endbachense]QHV97908.1 hypothetical protein GJR95_24150 [Spirosoma endbachense]
MIAEPNIQTMQLAIVLEKDDTDEIAGSVETDSFLLSTVGHSTAEVTENLRLLITDFLEHEGRELDEWRYTSIENIRFTYEYELPIVIERDDSNEIAGSIQTDGFFLSTVAHTTDDVTENLRMLISDFLEHEGRELDEWKYASIENIRFTYEYDVTALFDVFDVLKINSIAELAGLNKSLLRQYASGVKNPSEDQAKKIEAAVHDLGKRLLQVTVA